MNLAIQNCKTFSQNIEPNTFIGGVSATLGTPYLIAQKLGIAVNRVSGFKINGSDISFRVKGIYNLPPNCFLNNSSITYFIDNERMVNAFGGNSVFKNCINLEILEIYGLKTFGAGGFPKISNTKIETLFFPEMTTIIGNLSIVSNSLLKTIDIPIATTSSQSSMFANNNMLEYVNIPKVADKIGLNTLNNGWFNNCAIGCVINVHINMQTIDAGNPDGDLVSIIASRSAIVNYIP